MNTKDYIESGILELYATGTLSTEENKGVEEMLRQHAELREELNAIERALEAYAFAYAKKPSDKVMHAILSNIEVKEVKQTPSAKTIELNPANKSISNTIRYLAYAATILLFLSVAINIYYYNNYRRVQVELADMKDQNTMLADQYNGLQVDFQKVQSDMNIIKSPSFLAVTMKGQPVSPDAIAVVYWDKSTGKVYINANNLPAPEQGKQYQLWALKDGKPIDGGVFDLKGEILEMKNITEADAFAVTLEPQGGVPSPTGAIYVVGNV